MKPLYDENDPLSLAGLVDRKQITYFLYELTGCIFLPPDPKENATPKRKTKKKKKTV